MKKYSFLILTLIVACSPSPTEVEVQALTIPERLVDLTNTQLKRKAALVYFEDSLYSGYLVNYYENGGLRSKAGYVNGKLEGVSIQYYPDGQLKEQRIFEHNRKTGTHLGFWPNGQQKFEYHFEADLHIGELKEWYSSGQPYRFFNYHNGKEDGSQKMWMEDGKIRANYVVKDGHRYGLIGLKNCKSVSDEKGLYTALAY